MCTQVSLNVWSKSWRRKSKFDKQTPDTWTYSEDLQYCICCHQSTFRLLIKELLWAIVFDFSNKLPSNYLKWNQQEIIFFILTPVNNMVVTSAFTPVTPRSICALIRVYETGLTPGIHEYLNVFRHILSRQIEAAPSVGNEIKTDEWIELVRLL